MKVFTSKTQQLGEKGEIEGVRYLKKGGYQIVERNISNTYGEIDIVAKKGGVYYFFEVKAGNMGNGFNPAENLTKAKLRKLLISVEYYVLIHTIKEYRVQGIVVLFNTEMKPEIEILDIW